MGIISGSYHLNIWNSLGRHTTSLAWSLVASFCEVIIFVPSENEATYVTKPGQLTVVHIGVPGLRKMATIPLDFIDAWNESLAKELIKHNLSQVVLTNCDAWPAVNDYATKRGIPTIASVPYVYKHAHWLVDEERRNKILGIEKTCFAGVSKLIAHSVTLATAVMAVSQRVVEVVPTINILNDPLRSVEKQPNTLVYVGRLNKMKSVESILRAMAKLPFDITLSICTPEQSDGYAAKIRQTAELLDVGSRLKILGWKNSTGVKALMAESSLAIVSGMNEPYGFSVLDPMMVGTAVIVNEFSGLGDYLPKDDAGNSNAVYSNVSLLADLLVHKFTASDLREEVAYNRHHVETNYCLGSLTPLMREVVECR